MGKDKENRRTEKPLRAESPSQGPLALEWFSVLYSTSSPDPSSRP